jgi:hypothetical protein
LYGSRSVIRSLRVVAGEHSLNDESGLEQNRDVEKYLMHPRYTASTWEDDIALIVVSLYAVKFKSRVRSDENLMAVYTQS